MHRGLTDSGAPSFAVAPLWMLDHACDFSVVESSADFTVDDAARPRTPRAHLAALCFCSAVWNAAMAPFEDNGRKSEDNGRSSLNNCCYEHGIILRCKKAIVATSIKYYRAKRRLSQQNAKRRLSPHTSMEYYTAKKRLSPRASNTTVRKGDCRHTRAWTITMQKKRLFLLHTSKNSNAQGGNSPTRTLKKKKKDHTDMPRQQHARTHARKKIISVS